MNEDIEYRLDEIEINAKSKLSKNKRSQKILDSLDELDQPVTLLSSIDEKIEGKKKDKKEKKKKEESDDEDLAEWFDSLKYISSPKSKKKAKSLFGFGDGKGKKDKKSKKSDGKSRVNYKKEFEPEMALLRNLQISQSEFVSSLQKKYDQMENTKSTARGIGKFTTDLIDSINGARSLSLQIAEKIISTKKSIADLDFKERKEFGANNSEQTNINNYASSFLKQIVDTGRNNVVGQQQAYENFGTISDGDDTDDLFESITDSLGDTGRSEEAEKYLQYENDNVELSVIWHDAAADDNLDLKYDFIAHDKNGDVVDDYPLPTKTKMNINMSTGTATDIYGNKYKLIVD